MSQSISLLTLTIQAIAPITANRFMQANGLNGNSLIIGVARQDAAIGDYVPVDAVGTAMVEAAGAIPLGDKVAAAADGRAEAAGVNPVDGYSLQEATAAGQIIEVFLTPRGRA